MKVGWLIPPVAMVAVALAACGGSSTGVGASRTTSAASAGAAVGRGPTCAQVPRSLVSAALGEPLTGPQEQRTESTAVCTFTGTRTGVVIVRLASGVDAAGFAAEREAFAANGQRTTDVPGFLDGAYFSSLTALGRTTVTLVARRGDRQILVTGRTALATERRLIESLINVH